MADPRSCYKDPTHVARRICFHCGRAICTSCQLKIDHHLFCERSCYEEYAAARIATTNKRFKRYAAYATVFLLLGGFLYFALLADAFYNGGNLDAKPNSAQMGLSLPLNMQEQAAGEIMIHSPLNGMKSPSPTVQVEGPAPDKSVVALYLNGTMTDSTIANGGQYRFPHLLLPTRANVIQTRFYAENGSSDSSAPILVLYDHPGMSNDPKKSFFQNSSVNISRGNLNRKELALTFNGGREANSCEAILKSLEETNVPATVFLSYEFIQKFPDLTQQIASKHEVGNALEQTAFNSREEFQDQLRKTENLFRQVTGKQMVRFWRAPETAQITELRGFASELEYMHVAWTNDWNTRQSMDSLDYVASTSSPEYFPALLLKDRLLSFGQNETEQANGSIILMHLGTQRATDDRLDTWIPELIKTFHQRGYRFVTAGELIASL